MRTAHHQLGGSATVHLSNVERAQRRSQTRLRPSCWSAIIWQRWQAVDGMGHRDLILTHPVQIAPRGLAERRGETTR